MSFGGSVGDSGELTRVSFSCRLFSPLQLCLSSGGQICRFASSSFVRRDTCHMWLAKSGSFCDVGFVPR